MSELAKRLTELRGNAPLYSTSANLGVSPYVLREWEKGTRVPSVKELLQIAHYYKVSTDWLLSGN